MRQKITRYPGKDLTVITWVGRPEPRPTASELFKELLFNLSESFYFDHRLGKKDFLTEANVIVSKYGKIS